MKILEMTPDERPREKMMKNGAESLSDAELLSILFRTGVHGANAVDMARMLLKNVKGNLEILSTLSLEKLCSINGIGQGKAMTIAASVELGRRLAASIVANGKMVMDSPQDAAQLLSSLYSSQSREECWCLLLKRNRRLISSVKISDGTETMTELCIRKIVSAAIDAKASAIILSHNHLGGNPNPSSADVKETMKLKKALETFDLSLMDHIIISGRSCYSFSTENCFEF